MIDATFIVVIVGLVALLFTVVWSDRRQDRRFDKQDERLSAIELGFVEARTELKALRERVDKHDERFDELQSEMRGELRDARDERRTLDAKVDALGSKVDRMQGTLDVLVFGERGVPPPVARERAEAEGRVEETVGD